MLLKNKRCLITGASSGIGKALAFALAEKGACCILICRNKDKAEEVKKEIIKRTDNKNIHLIIIDLSLQSSIRKGVQQISKIFDTVDILINNAGTFSFEYTLTGEGIEKTIATNFFAPFLLTNLLIGTFNDNGRSHIINIVSEGTTKG